MLQEYAEFADLIWELDSSSCPPAADAPAPPPAAPPTGEGAAAAAAPSQAAEQQPRRRGRGDGASDAEEMARLPPGVLPGDRQRVYHTVQRVEAGPLETTLWLHNPYQVCACACAPAPRIHRSRT